MIASLSIPWGEDKSDDELGGYHLVWTRDMVNAATALLAVGDTATPLRAMIYLAIAQREDGGFYQNFWIDGRPYWTGVQLDEVSFPIILAWRLWKANALGNFDPYVTVLRACGYLIREGPATPEERWEEAGRLFAFHAGQQHCGPDLRGRVHRGARRQAHRRIRAHLCRLPGVARREVDGHRRREPWCPASRGTIFASILLSARRATRGDEDPDSGELVLANQRPGDRYRYPANQIVDAGFLELVRFGIRKAGDPLIEDSLKVVDAVLKVDTPEGPVLEALQPRRLRPAR